MFENFKKRSKDFRLMSMPWATTAPKIIFVKLFCITLSKKNVEITENCSEKTHASQISQCFNKTSKKMRIFYFDTIKNLREKNK